MQGAAHAADSCDASTPYATTALDAGGAPTSPATDAAKPTSGLEWLGEPMSTTLARRVHALPGNDVEERLRLTEAIHDGTAGLAFASLPV